MEFHWLLLLDNTKGPFNCTDGDVKLFGGSTPYEGTLHICVNKAWSTVCWRNNWQSVNTAVVCQQLGYTVYGTVTPSPSYFPLCFSFSCFPLYFPFLLFLLFSVIIFHILFNIKVISIHVEGQMTDILLLLLDWVVKALKRQLVLVTEHQMLIYNIVLWKLWTSNVKVTLARW